MAKTINEKIIHAEQMAAKFLADANIASEKGNVTKAEQLYDKSQNWLDKLNKLQGWV